MALMKLWQQVTQAHSATGRSTRLRDRQAAIVFYTLCIPTVKVHERVRMAYRLEVQDL